MAAKRQYNEDSIQRFAGLSGIRRKPQIYAGVMDGNGLWTTWREPADNAVDQALARRNRLVHLIEDGPRRWVIDEGEGIPVGVKSFADEHGKQEKLSTLYVTTGLVHGGGNFSGEEISRGTHGIGVKLTNATAVYLKVWTFREGAWYYIEYNQMKLKNPAAKTKPQRGKPPKLPHGIKLPKRGTIVCFEPELKLFHKGSKINPQDVLDWCELTSYLVAGLEVKLTDARGKTRSFKTKNGPLDYVTKRLAELKAEPMGKPFVMTSRELDIAVTWANCEGMEINSYTNGLLNADGGRHLDAFFDALLKALKPYTTAKMDYKLADLRDGVLGLVNAKLAAPQFSNQIKAKLIDDRIYPLAQPQMLAELTKFFAANKTLAKEICQRATDLRKKTDGFLKDKQLVRNVRAAKTALSSKFADVADSRTPVDKRELYLVEGDSAGGTAKVARYKAFQAVFGLRGKVLNVMDATKDKVNNNKEVAQIFAGIGLDLGQKDPVKSLRFGKIIFLADPDVDGGHITCLLLTLFWKYLPDLYQAGRIYIVASPEYYARHKGKIFFGDTREHLYKQAGTQKLDVHHIKGWGEINAEEMQPIAFDIGRGGRRLYRIKPPDTAEGRREFEALMGKNPAYRQKFLGVGDSEEE